MVKCAQLVPQFTVQSCFSLRLHQDGQQIRQLQLHPKLIPDTPCECVCGGEFRDTFKYLLQSSKTVLIRMLEECWDRRDDLQSTSNILKHEPLPLGSLWQLAKETNEGSAQDLVGGASLFLSFLTASTWGNAPGRTSKLGN